MKKCSETNLKPSSKDINKNNKEKRHCDRNHMKPSLQKNQITRQNKILNALGDPMRVLKKECVFIKIRAKIRYVRYQRRKQIRKDSSYMKNTHTKLRIDTDESTIRDSRSG